MGEAEQKKGRRVLNQEEQIALVVTILQERNKNKLFKQISRRVFISLGIAVTAETCRRIYRRVIRK